MLNIEVSTVDELFDISLKLGVVTYLLDLVIEHNEITEYDINLDFGKNHAIEFLLKNQLDAVTDFRKLIESNKFTTHIENDFHTDR